MGALLSFLGGSVFRMVWGEVSAWFQKRQDHAQELDRLKLQGELDAARHGRDLERMRLQHDLGVREMQVAGDIAIEKTEAAGFFEAFKAAQVQTGIAWVDAWNAMIRPEFAQLALCLWVAKVVGQGFVMDEYDRELSCAILGFFVADRSLGKRGK
jgi:hypothetical protein